MAEETTTPVEVSRQDPQVRFPGTVEELHGAVQSGALQRIAAALESLAADVTVMRMLAEERQSPPASPAPRPRKKGGAS